MSAACRDKDQGSNIQEDLVLVYIIVCGNFYLEQLKAKAFVKQVDMKGVMR